MTLKWKDKSDGDEEGDTDKGGERKIINTMPPVRKNEKLREG